MTTQLVKISRISGWIAISLGIIHTANTWFVIDDIANMNRGWQGIFLYMYVATGLACLLAGGGMLMSVSSSIRNLKIAHHIYLISAIFMLFLGIGAPLAMRNNPFGYIALAVGVFATSIALLRYRQNLLYEPNH